jgi:hypothetical protein
MTTKKRRKIEGSSTHRKSISQSSRKNGGRDEKQA